MTGHNTDCAGMQVAVKLQSYRAPGDYLRYSTSEDIRIVTKKAFLDIQAV
jgi:hypothetical protein